MVLHVVVQDLSASTVRISGSDRQELAGYQHQLLALGHTVRSDEALRVADGGDARLSCRECSNRVDGFWFAGCIVERRAAERGVEIRDDLTRQ